jgi:hypothetical protein
MRNGHLGDEIGATLSALRLVRICANRRRSPKELSSQNSTNLFPIQKSIESNDAQGVTNAPLKNLVPRTPSSRNHS